MRNRHGHEKADFLRPIQRCVADDHVAKVDGYEENIKQHRKKTMEQKLADMSLLEEICSD